MYPEVPGASPRDLEHGSEGKCVGLHYHLGKMRRN